MEIQINPIGKQNLCSNLIKQKAFLLLHHPEGS